MHMVDHITSHHRDVLKISFFVSFQNLSSQISVAIMNVIYLKFLDR